MSNIIDGVKIKMAGTDYIVPPLSFKHLRKLQPKLTLLGNIIGVPSDEQMEAVTELVHAALSRNYPEMTPDSVEELIDLSNLSTIMNAIMGVSGLVQGEAAAGNS